MSEEITHRFGLADYAKHAAPPVKRSLARRLLRLASSGPARCVRHAAYFWLQGEALLLAKGKML